MKTFIPRWKSLGYYNFMPIERHVRLCKGQEARINLVVKRVSRLIVVNRLASSNLAIGKLICWCDAIG